MAERTRVRCPVCNMVTDLDRIEKLNDTNFQLWLQTFGGMHKGVPRRGYMTYDEITDPVELEEAKQIFLKRMALAQKKLSRKFP